MKEIRELGKLSGANIREAKQRLAFETTVIVHGSENALQAQQTADSLFSGSKTAEGRDNSNMPSTVIDSERISLVFPILPTTR